MKNLITDVNGLRVGNAHDAAIRTGTTVLTSDRPFTAGVHVMGGAPGTRETELLSPDRLVQEVDALVLSGGSAFGLAAADGVMEGLQASGRGFPIGPMRVPIVPTAILFDLLNGGDKDWTTPPYRALGLTALENAKVDFELGSAGAGYGATTARLRGGLGSASMRTSDGFTVGALVAVNAVGEACDPTGRFWAAPWEEGDEFGNLGPVARAEDPAPTKLSKGATTIAIVATDAPLTQAQCTRMAVAAHDGIARAIVPAHTPFDGDLVFAVSTGTGSPVDDAALLEIGHGASVALARAIARGVYLAAPSGGIGRPSWTDRYDRSA